jgi:hypothetical protein
MFTATSETARRIMVPLAASLLGIAIAGGVSFFVKIGKPGTND